MREYNGWFRFDDKKVRKIEDFDTIDYMTAKGSGMPYIAIYQKI
jgi:hypothetical protein